MKKMMKKLSCLILFGAILLICSATAFADGTVTYDENSRDFIFVPGSNYSPSDLFTDFKDVMPGDSITQKITIDNKIEKNVKIKLYMRSLAAVQGSEEFLSHLNLTVRQEGNSNLFASSADQTAQLTDWVYLGTIYSGGRINLDVTLNVPITLENRFQYAVGYLDWQFKAEELPVNPDDPKPPQTGDTFTPTPWLLLMGISSAMIFVLLVTRRQKEKAVGCAN